MKVNREFLVSIASKEFVLLSSRTVPPYVTPTPTICACVTFQARRIFRDLRYLSWKSIICTPHQLCGFKLYSCIKDVIYDYLCEEFVTNYGIIIKLNISIEHGALSISLLTLPSPVLSEKGIYFTKCCLNETRPPLYTRHRLLCFQ